MKTNWGKLFSRLFAVTVVMQGLLVLADKVGNSYVAHSVPPNSGTKTIIVVLFGVLAALAWFNADRFCKDTEVEDAVEAKSIVTALVAAIGAFFLFVYGGGLIVRMAEARSPDTASTSLVGVHIGVDAFIAVVSVLVLLNARRVAQWIGR